MVNVEVCKTSNGGSNPPLAYISKDFDENNNDNEK